MALSVESMAEVILYEVFCMMFEKKGNEKVQVAKKYVCLLFFLVLGNVLIAFGVCAFVVPNRFMMGGTTGIALALQHIVPLKLSALSGILYGGLFFLGLFALGREFAAASLFSSFFFPVVLGFFETMPLASLFLQDRTVAALSAALVCGSGVGLIIRAGGSSGGMDIPPCVLWKYRGIPVGTSMFFFDAAILAAQMCFQGELTSVSSHYKMFNTKGNPVRGEIQLTIRQSEDVSAKYSNKYWEKAFTKAFGDSMTSGLTKSVNSLSRGLSNSVLNLNI